MAYVELELPDSLPESVHTVIRTGVEPLLGDVHRMLAMPPEAYARPSGRQMQQPIALVLLATVAGVSSKKLLHVPAGEPSGDGDRFRRCLTRFYPWDLDPPSGVLAEEASQILYKTFRNPLVHFLGMSKSGTPKIRIGRGHPGGDGNSRIEDLERMSEKPYSEPCLVVTPDRATITMWLEPFYWGVRILVERWSRDFEQVSAADAKLRQPAADGRPPGRR